MPYLPLAGSGAADQLTGLAGVAARLISSLGEVGVGVSTLVETVFPPIPSEVILPLAGYLAQRGQLNLVLVIVAATVGGWLGALVLYALGARLGEERGVRWLSRLPLVDANDFERSAAWFHRHGRSAVFFGRLVPGVRSLISLPAGAAHMGLIAFSALTIAGSLLWNVLLVGLGVALGTQYQLVNRYSAYINYILYAVIAAFVIALVVRKVRRARRPQHADHHG